MAYERRDIDLRIVLLFLAGLVLAGVVVQGGMALLALGFQRARATTHEPPPARRAEAPGPPLVVPPARQAIARQEAVLRTYGWVDREHGAVRIPVERAMDLIVDRLPIRPEKGGGK